MTTRGKSFPGILHLCHADGCDERTGPRMVFCPEHWGMVPLNLQKWIWEVYTPEHATPSEEYLQAILTAIKYVAEIERRSSSCRT